MELASAAMGAHIGTIALPAANEEYDAGTVCTVTGWGTTTEGGSLAKVLQKVTSHYLLAFKCFKIKAAIMRL